MSMLDQDIVVINSGSITYDYPKLHMQTDQGINIRQNDSQE
jgi:hypothetical protein